jgi:predicted nucleic acid-binding protein
MPDRIVIADSDPLIALAGVACLHLLPRLYPRVVAPHAVIDEVMAGINVPTGDDILEQAPWLERVGAPTQGDTLSIALGRGEAEAIALARQYPESLLLIDDRQARRAASAIGLRATGSSGVLVRAKAESLIEAVKPRLLAMRQNGYYLSDRVIQRACQMAGETEAE